MSSSLHDYLLSHDGVDWTKAFEAWGWLLPPKFTVWMVNKCCDCFLVLPDGAVYLLDTGGGTLEKLADSKDEFGDIIDQSDNANQWLMIPLVDRCRAAGMKLSDGQCYGFKKPTVLGGDYTVENCIPIAIVDYIGAMGAIHFQIKDLPNGTAVDVRVLDSQE